MSLGFEKKKSIRYRAVVLVERDYDILEYILEMKFASLQNVFEKFFSRLQSGEEAKSNEWATRRLQQLTKAGFLKAAYSFSHRARFYLLTNKGYEVLRKGRLSLDPLGPSFTIDHRTFDHDRLVLESRIMLENRRAASCWVSDKRLRSSRELAGGLVLSHVPDGLFVNERGEKVAFELEYSVKPRKVLEEKIRRYVMMIRSSDERLRVFDRVLYVCARPMSYERVKKEIEIYGDLIEVMMLDQFFGKRSGS